MRPLIMFYFSLMINQTKLPPVCSSQLAENSQIKSVLLTLNEPITRKRSRKTKARHFSKSTDITE